MADSSVPRCSVCGRVLTSAASIARGIGPECAGLVGPKKPAKPSRSKRVFQGSAAALPSASSAAAVVVTGSGHDDLHEESVAQDEGEQQHGS